MTRRSSRGVGAAAFCILLAFHAPGWAADAKDAKSKDGKTSGTAAPAQTPEAASDGPSFTWKQLIDKAAFLSIENPTAKEQTIAVSLSEFGFQDEKGSSLENAAAGLGAPESPKDKLKPGAILRIPLSLNNPKQLRSGQYKALWLVRRDGKDPEPAHITITVPSIKPLPATEEVQSEAIRYCPLCPWPSDFSVPLTASGNLEGMGLTQDTPLGILRRDGGPGYAVVSWQKPEKATALSAKQPKLPVSVDGISAPGVYKGTLTFPGGATFPFSLEATDFVLYPALAILAGIYLGSMAKRWINISRSIAVLRGKVAQLGVDFTQAEASYRDITQAQPFRANNIRPDFEKRWVSILSQLRSPITVAAPLDKNNESYQQILKELKELSDIPTQWPAFGTSLVALQESLQQVSESAGDARKPKLLEVQSLLAPAPAMTQATFTKARADVAEALANAATWETLNGDIESAVNLFGVLQANPKLKTDPTDLAALQSADPAKLVGELDHAATETQLGTVDAKLTESKSSLESLRDKYKVAPAETLKRMSAFRSAESEDLPTKAPPDAGEELRAAEKTLQLGDKLAFLIAIVAGVSTGLSTYYIGKPFGTLGDYITVFLWGLGSKMVVDLASSGLDKALQAITGKAASAEA